MKSSLFAFLARLRPRSRRQLQRDVDEELEFHIDMQTEELESQGFTSTEAREEALRRFGNLSSTRSSCVREDARRERLAHQREYLAEVVQDLLHGWRQLRQSPGFAVAAILTLGLSIGATTTVFTAADRLLFRPLPYSHADRIVALSELDSKTGEKRDVSPGNYADWRDRTSVFAGIGLAEPFGFDITGDGPPQAVSAWLVTSDFLRVLGVRPLLGRSFDAGDFESDAASVVLLSHDLWRTRYGSSASIVGKTIGVDGAPATVVGVLPEWAQYPDSRDMWAPKVLRSEELVDRSSSYMKVVGLLRAGVTLARARADLDRVTAAMSREYPRSNATIRARLAPLEEQIRGPVRPALLMLLGAVVLVLLIACANVASLLLARGNERGREFGIRAALGASPARLVRQVMTEGALLAALGGVLGLALAYGGVRLFTAFGPSELAGLGEMAIDARVIAFGVITTAMTAILSGLGPAIRASRMEPLPSLSVGRGSDPTSRGMSRLRTALVIGEVSLAVVLLIGAGLLTQSFMRLRSNDLGFHVEDRVSLQVFLWDRNPTAAQRIQRVDEILDQFRRTPGVAGAAVVSALPFHPHQIDARGELAIQGQPDATDSGGRMVYTTVASPEYFSLLRIPLRQGLSFTDHDRAEAPKVALVNETLARRYFPGESPIGKHVTVGVMGPPESREVIGVVGDVRPVDLDSAPRAELYVPYAQSATGSVTFVVHAPRGAATLPTLTSGLWTVDPGQAVYHAATLPQLVSITLAERRFNLALVSLFSVLALLLATIGIYGLISYTTSRRTQEIGIRIALGARPADVVRLILQQGLRLVLWGLTLGIAGGLFAMQFLRHMLYHVDPADPLTLSLAAGVLFVAAGLAIYVPARRATQLEPAAAIQSG